ncbi:MAG TPA: phosphatidate cytidylyltransferase [Vicinamibacteria bacterium]|nr:phosphatidate cytidylyltransferase [Vicinamibacteria bacterium]
MSFAPNLGRRLATAAVAIPLLVLALFAAPPWVLVAVVALACALGLHEMFALLSAAAVRPLPVAGFVAAALLFAGTVDGWPVSPLAAAAVVVAWVALRGVSDYGDAARAAMGTLFAATYLGALGGTMAGLRTLAPLDEGPWRVALLLAIVMMADSAAYFAGSAFGRRKLAPRISPAKTWEGAAGAVLGGIVAAIVVRRLGLPRLPLLDAVALGAAVAVAGTAGDLFESLLKRWAGVKDSGTLFPGHGGMLDRLDSLLFAAPVLYYYFLYAL